MKKSEIYLRLIVSSEYEKNFIISSAFESQGLIDGLIITEFNRTHTGEPREQIFSEIKSELEALVKTPIYYFFEDMSEVAKVSHEKSEYLHFNEWYMRAAFLHLMNLNDSDLVIAVDADEIIYRKTFEVLRIINMIIPGRVHLHLKLHQFFYKPDILWTKFSFWAPTAASIRVLSKQEQPQWRYTGFKYPFWAGCHFSWNMPISGMIRKLTTYSHSDLYKKFADPDILNAAISDLKYPFEPDRKVVLRKLSKEMSQKLHPKSVGLLDWSYLDDFKS